MFKKCFLFILPLFFLLSCNRKPSRNSTQKILNTHEKIRVNLSDSNYIFLKQTEKLIQLNPEIADSIKIENDYLLGNYFFAKRKLDSATLYFHNAINLINSENIKGKYHKYFTITWTTDLKNEQYSNGISVANKYIELLDEEKDADKLQYAYYFLGQINHELGNFEKELFYYKKALKFAKASTDSKLSKIILITIAEPEYYVNKERAFFILDSLSQLKNNSNHINRTIYHVYGVLMFYNNEFNKAIKNYKKSIHFLKNNSESIHYNYDLTSSYSNIAEAYIELKDIESSETYLDSASTYLTKSSESSEFSFIGKLRISLSLLKDNSEKDIHAVFDELVKKQNEKYKEKINEELLALTEANENEKLLTVQKNEKEIDNLKLQSRNLILGILIILISSSGYLFYRHRKLKFEKQNLQMQQRLLRSQMNPHFISNILNVIKTSIKKNKETSLIYISKFSRLLRIVLENSTQNYVILEKEFESLQKYLDLQLLRFPEKFSYSFKFNGIEENDLLYIPPMLIQPFIENSIEHGFFNIDYKGEIVVTLSLHENSKFLICNITDNGNGLSINANKQSKSISIQLISDFILKTTKTKISILDKKIVDKNQHGTEVSFLIPFKYSKND